MKVLELDKEKLSNILIMVVPISCKLNHQSVKSSLQDYVLPGDDNPEAQFVRDIFTLKSLDLAEKWYGGIEQARSLTFQK